MSLNGHTPAIRSGIFIMPFLNLFKGMNKAVAGVMA
jgi:hypothetical protein